MRWWKSCLGTAVLIALLLLGIGGDRVAAQETLPPDDQEILERIAALQATDPGISDTFRRDTGRWRVFESDDAAISYVERALHVSVTSDQWVAWSRSDLELSDFYAEIDVVRLAGPADSEAGLIFRYQDVDNFYFFAVNGLGAYNLLLRRDGEWDSLTGWVDSDAVRTGVWQNNHLGVLADGPVIALLVNDQLVQVIEDGSVESGILALAAGTFDEGGLEIAFDNLDLWDLEALSAAVRGSAEREVARVVQTEPDWLDDFHRNDGTWEVVTTEDVDRFYRAGAYHIEVLTDALLAWSVSDVEAADFYLEVDTAHVAGPLNNEISVVYRFVDNDNFYLFSISSDGYYRLRKQVDGEFITVIEWTPSDAIEVGEETINRVAVYARGPYMAFFVNGILVDETQDSSLSSGSIGLAAGSFEEPGVEVAFDNLALWELAPLPAIVEPSAPIVRETPEVGLLDERLAEIVAAPPSFVDTFRRDVGHWEALGGDTEESAGFYAGGAYHITVAKTNWVAWTSAVDLELADFYLELDTAHVAGSLDNQLGVLFRYQDEGNFYKYVISSDGFYALHALVDSEWVEILPWQQSDAINTGEGSSNHLGLLVQGDEIALMVNDTVLDVVYDDTFASGGIALAAGAFLEPPIEVAFDELTIWDLAE
ncbi:MAG: hypothetical protein Kow0047_09660 [Anaerolineae bacterium]